MAIATASDGSPTAVQVGGERRGDVQGGAQGRYSATSVAAK